MSPRKTRPAPRPKAFLLLLLIAITSVIILKLLLSQLQKDTPLTPKQALTLVENRPEVKEFMKKVPRGFVSLQNSDQADQDIYLIQVYEVVDNHTATFNWYEVNKNTKEVKTQF